MLSSRKHKASKVGLSVGFMLKHLSNRDTKIPGQDVGAFGLKEPFTIDTAT